MLRADFDLDNVDDVFGDDGIVEVHFALRAVFHFSVFESKESIVASHTDVLAGDKLRAFLAHQNHSGFSRSSIADFYTAILRI